MSRLYVKSLIITDQGLWETIRWPLCLRVLSFLETFFKIDNWYAVFVYGSSIPINIIEWMMALYCWKLCILMVWHRVSRTVRSNIVTTLSLRSNVSQGLIQGWSLLRCISLWLILSFLHHRMEASLWSKTRSLQFSTRFNWPTWSKLTARNLLNGHPYSAR